MTESFLPTLNGVTTSVCRILDCLREAGHEALVICPGPAPSSYQGFPVHTVNSVTVRQFRIGNPATNLEQVIRSYGPDVVHAASPFGLGARGLAAARNLRIPSVAIYQTDMPSYLKQHGGPAGGLVEKAAWRWIRHLHTLADVTLVPSTQTLQELSAAGVPRTALWSRGVDTVAYDPALRSTPEVADLRDMLAPNGETIIGYVGRLAPEKELGRLEEIRDLPGTHLCIIGDGPSRPALERMLPRASFLGYRQGAPLAQAYAALDVFVHTGTKETFGQTLQEAMATGLPVVAPAAGGPLDIVKPGVTGLLFDPTHEGALRQAVGGLVADAAMRERMGLSARSKVADRSWAKLVDELLGYYGSVIAPSWAERAA